MEKLKNVPEIRFGGFTEEWKASSMGFLFDFQYGIFNNNPSNGGEFPVYGANGIIGSYTDYNSEDAVVIGHMGEYAGVVLWVNGKHFVTYNGIITKPATESLDSKFGYFLLKKEDIRKICGGSGQPFLSYDMLNKIATFYPIRISEQLKISDFFQNLDNLIKNHNTQLKKLTNLKKAMLLKMFPQDGASVPEIRFKGFDGEWEEKTLEQLATISTGYPFDSKVFNSKGRFFLVTNGNIQNDSTYVNNISSNRLDISNDLKGFILNPDDVLVTMDGTVGRTAKVKYENQVLAQRVGRLKATNDVDFLYHTLNTGFFFQTMTNIAIGGTVKHISLTNISQYSCFAPKNIKEQEKIGNYFKNLDDLIENHKEQLKKLNQIKKACLSKLFVSQD